MNLINLNEIMYRIGCDMANTDDLKECKNLFKDCLDNINNLLNLEESERQSQIRQFDEAYLGCLEP